jgi:hypothetical protein
VAPFARIINLRRADGPSRRVVSELDIWRAANLLIRQHGANAVSEATRLAGPDAGSRRQRQVAGMGADQASARGATRCHPLVAYNKGRPRDREEAALSMSEPVQWDDGYMLDTTEFNAVGKGDLPIFVFIGHRLYATHVQIDELQKTPCERLRAKLCAEFEQIAAENLPTESLVWGISKWGQGKWGTRDGLFKKMRGRLEELDKKKRQLNQFRDILIAETAIRQGSHWLAAMRTFDRSLSSLGAGQSVARISLIVIGAPNPQQRTDCRDAR